MFCISHKLPDNMPPRFWICVYVWFKYDLGQKYHAPQVQPSRGLNSWPPDHDSIFHVTETPAITTRPSVTSEPSLRFNARFALHVLAASHILFQVYRFLMILKSALDLPGITDFNIKAAIRKVFIENPKCFIFMAELHINAHRQTLCSMEIAKQIYCARPLSESFLYHIYTNCRNWTFLTHVICMVQCPIQNSTLEWQCISKHHYIKSVIGCTSEAQPLQTGILAICALHSFAVGKLYHHSMFHNPTAAVNLFHVGKQYLTFLPSLSRCNTWFDW